jgi:hypothetical protein
MTLFIGLLLGMLRGDEGIVATISPCFHAPKPTSGAKTIVGM